MAPVKKRSTELQENDVLQQLIALRCTAHVNVKKRSQLFVPWSETKCVIQDVENRVGRKQDDTLNEHHGFGTPSLFSTFIFSTV